MEALGSAFPDRPAPRALPRSSQTDPGLPTRRGRGPKDLRSLGVGGRALGSAKFGCLSGVSRVRPWEPNRFRGQVRVWWSTLSPVIPVIRGGPGPGLASGAEVAPPRVCPPHPWRPRGSGRDRTCWPEGSPRGAPAQRIRRPPPAQRPRWETQSERFAPYLPSVRPILFSALKTDMSNWQLVPNRVQRSLVEHFYSCLLQLDAYSCRLNEKQNVL